MRPKRKRDSTNGWSLSSTERIDHLLVHSSGTCVEWAKMHREWMSDHVDAVCDAVAILIGESGVGGGD